jgi:small subunit ribosomal protein S4
MPKRSKKIYSRPKKIYDKATIISENALIKKYGLKSRREVWKAEFAIRKIRGIAKSLITADEKEKEEFVKRQKEKGFNINTIAEVLSLSKEDYLKRRLQSVVVAKGFCSTPKQARQLITHKHISLNGNRIDSPSHLTTLSEENTIKTDLNLGKKKEMTEEEKAFLKKMKKGNEKAEENNMGVEN